MKPTKTIDQIREMLKDDDYEESKTIGETEGMFVKHKNEIVEVVTIKKLYEMAIAKGMENAAIGISFYDEETNVDYCEEIKFKDIEFGGLYYGGNKKENKVCDCIWLNSHDF